MFDGKVGLAVLAVMGLVGVGLPLASFAGGPPEEATYVGPNKCRICHMEEHNTWKEMAHADAFGDLIGPEVTNPDCYKCHVTGYGEPGGYESPEETPELKNVSCEACHGPGSAHVEAAGQHLGDTGEWDRKINKVPQNTCVECHNPHINQKKRAEKLREERGAGE
ncbi:MAG: cytochrome c family protein [Planctomycetota bacterium]